MVQPVVDYVRELLGLPIGDNITTCACGVAASNRHIRTCKLPQSAIIARHNCVLKAVSSIARRSFAVVEEPKGLTKSDNRRPDLVVFKSDGQVAIDVAVTFVESSSSLSSKATSKRSKYRDVEGLWVIACN